MEAKKFLHTGLIEVTTGHFRRLENESLWGIYDAHHTISGFGSCILHWTSRLSSVSRLNTQGQRGIHQQVS